MVLKFTTDGKFVKQLGKRGPLTIEHGFDASSVWLPALELDAKANEIYAADGYGNHRVAVLDGDTGDIKRIWGAYGKPPTDDNAAGLQRRCRRSSPIRCIASRSPKTVLSMSAIAPTIACRCFTRTAVSCGNTCSSRSTQGLRLGLGSGVLAARQESRIISS